MVCQPVISVVPAADGDECGAVDRLRIGRGK
jgi:hypothetical protein